MSKNVSFRTERKKKNSSKRWLTALFVTALVGFAVLSVFYILSKNDFDIRSAVGGDVQPGGKNEEEQVNADEKEERYYLFWCKDAETNELVTIWVTKVRLPQGRYNIYSPSIDDTVEYGDEYLTFGRIFELYGESGIRKAAEDLCGIKIDAYIGSDSANFRQMINYLGSVTVNLDEAINYNQDFNLILGKGENVLKGDSLYKFLVYTNFMQGDTRTIRENILAEILSNTISPGKSDRTDKLFSRIANQLISDITIVDFSADREFTDRMFETGVKDIYLVEKPSQITK